MISEPSLAIVRFFVPLILSHHEILETVTSIFFHCMQISLPDTNSSHTTFLCNRNIPFYSPPNLRFILSFHNLDVHCDFLEHIQALKYYSLGCCCDVSHQRCNIQLLGRLLDYCRRLQHHFVPLALTSRFNLAIFKRNCYMFF